MERAFVVKEACSNHHWLLHQQQLFGSAVNMPVINAVEGVIHNQITLFGTLTITIIKASRLSAIQFISEIKENATTSTSTSASVLASK
ncbi:MULE domain-containing protein [Aphis craccivora]|uniref:MULE domain-containing protein n=1 Tax=Aphis craccivora TaxID=307492 RepID=A0A6G0X7U4_APHCR|nr:MULE domain-containing protein [Aphis craccivora]